jgi:aminoglycoside phosphotransferase (APT) family kinase protein
MRVDLPLVDTDAHPRMHEDELAIDAGLVRRLLAVQMPMWAGMPVRPVGRGTVNAMFRLGDDLAVRLPRTAEWAGDLDRERAWLPRLRDRLTLQVPEPVASGEPTREYPLPWAVYRWVDGDQYADALVDDEAAAADDLARFVQELRGASVEGAPATGRRPLAELDEWTRAAVVEAADLLDTSAVLDAWDRSLEAPVFAGEKVWIHTDLLRPNLLVRGGRLAAVIDFGAVGVGDPAADVIAAWAVFGAAGRARYREMLDVDDATWDRARGYALTQAALIVPYYRETNAPFTASALRTIGEVLADLSFDAPGLRPVSSRLQPPHP